jgi:ribosomal protein L7Ae-like RNA K-turn-binding protein
VRICSGCGERKEKSEMVRIVADPSGLLIPDLKGNLPSRGAYVCPDASCIGKASTGRLRASLKVPKDSGAVSEGLQKAVADVYRRRIISLLGQAKKSGKFISGTNLVEGEIRRGPNAHWLAVLARDVSDDISEKMLRNLESASVPFRYFFSKDELGDALGKSPRSVVLVKDTGLAKAIVESIDRYLRVLNKGGSDQ